MSSRAAALRAGTSRRRPTFFSVVGELLITAGLFVLLFVAWELWWTDIQADREQDHIREQVISDWEPDPGFQGEDIDPAVPAEVAEGSGAWGILYVPRLGEEWSVPIADGVSLDVINDGVVGRYPSSPRPGEDGNLAVAGHRQTNGSILWDMDQVVPGDTMYVQTANGWWVYETVQNHIVMPSAVEVLDPDPMNPGGPVNGQWLTVTTCHPLYTTRERMVTHAQFVDFVPLSDGAPSEIATAAAGNETPAEVG